MSYTEHTWQTGETITAAKMNNIEEGIQEAAQSGGGGWDLVVKMSKPFPDSATTFTVISGDTAANLYDKLMDGNPIAILLLGYYMSDIYVNVCPWICWAYTSSVTDTIFFQGISSGDQTWPSWAQIQYDSNGISFVE